MTLRDSFGQGSRPIGNVTAWVARAIVGLGLCGCLLAACGVTPPPTVTPTVTMPAPTATPAPTLTATATYTPVPTRTPNPVAVSEDGAPTPTWTAVPGNPIWSFWKYESVEFQLPVAWHKGPESSTGGSLYDGPDSDGRPQLSITITNTSAGDDSAGLAHERLAEMKSTLTGFSTVQSGAASMSGLQAQRATYRYNAPALAAGGSNRKMRGLAWYAVRNGVGFSFEFSADERRFGSLEKTFDDIIARVNIRP